MDVLIVLPDLRGGGVEKMRLALAKEFHRRGMTVGLALLRKEGTWLDDVPAEIPIFDLQAPRIRGAIRPLARLLKETQPRSLLVGMWPLPIVALLARRIAGVKSRIVVSEHSDYRVGPKSSIQKQTMMRLSMRFYAKAEGIVCVSGGVADTVSKLSRVSRERINVIYNPIEKPRWDEEPEEGIAGEWLRYDEGARLLAVGSLKEQKNFPLLIRALPQVMTKIDAKLLILGEGSLRAELEALVRSLNLQDKVILPGFVKNPAPFMRAAKLFILSSSGEGFGNVLVEAMACGTNIVSTDCHSGPREILQGTRGRLTSVDSVDDMAQAILLGCSEDQNTPALRSRAAEFSLDRSATQYLKLLLPAA